MIPKYNLLLKNILLLLIKFVFCFYVQLFEDTNKNCAFRVRWLRNMQKLHASMKGKFRNSRYTTIEILFIFAKVTNFKFEKHEYEFET